MGHLWHLIERIAVNPLESTDLQLSACHEYNLHNGT